LFGILRLPDPDIVMKVTRAMQIALVAPGIPQSATGVSVSIARLAAELCNAGHKVTLVAADTVSSPGTVEPMVKVDPRVDLRLFPFRSRGHRRLHLSAEIREWLNQSASNFDVMDIQGVWSFVTVHAAQAARRANVPYVLTPHGQMALWDWQKMPWRKRSFFEGFVKSAWRRATAIRFVSDGEADSSMASAGTRRVVIPYWVDQPAAKDSENCRLELARRTDIPRDAAIILFLGRLSAQKGVLEIVEAFDHLWRTRKNVALVLAGPLDGEYGAQVTRVAARVPSARNIRLLGPVYDEGKEELFRAASLFITLSKNEGLPIAVLEAMAHGLPIVATGQAHLPELSQYKAGIVVSSDPIHVAQAIDSVLIDRERLQRMATNARHLIEERFTAQTVTPQILALYDKMARQPPVSSLE
jgi:glycosyltransferase involved in cell wall biosynthesis